MKAIYLSLLVGFFNCAALAQQPGPSPNEVIASLNWVKAPSVAQLDNRATIKLSGNLLFLNKEDTNKFLQANGNLPQYSSFTLADGRSNWFAILRFVDDGYVKDDEKIDASALLKKLKEDNAAANEERRKKGVPELFLEDWYFAPRYDTESKRLEWGTRLRSSDSSEPTINVTTKILGRHGYYSVILVSSPQTMEADMREFKAALGKVEYASGEKYSEWREGDKVAAYGLGALVLGGAAAVATKKGGLKLIGIAIFAGLAAMWAFIKRFFKKT